MAFIRCIGGRIINTATVETITDMPVHDFEREWLRGYEEPCIFARHTSGRIDVLEDAIYDELGVELRLRLIAEKLIAGKSVDMYDLPVYEITLSREEWLSVQGRLNEAGRGFNYRHLIEIIEAMLYKRDREDFTVHFTEAQHRIIDTICEGLGFTKNKKEPYFGTPERKTPESKSLTFVEAEWQEIEKELLYKGEMVLAEHIRENCQADGDAATIYFTLSDYDKVEDVAESLGII